MFTKIKTRFRQTDFDSVAPFLIGAGVGMFATSVLITASGVPTGKFLYVTEAGLQKIKETGEAMSIVDDKLGTFLVSHAPSA